MASTRCFMERCKMGTSIAHCAIHNSWILLSLWSDWLENIWGLASLFLSGISLLWIHKEHKRSSVSLNAAGMKNSRQFPWISSHLLDTSVPMELCLCSLSGHAISYQMLFSLSPGFLLPSPSEKPSSTNQCSSSCVCNQSQENPCYSSLLLAQAFPCDPVSWASIVLDTFL